MKKGPLFEAQVVAWLRDHGFPYAERRVMGGARDRGDITGIPGVCLELKNCKQMSLGPWMDEAAVEAARGGDAIFAVVHKRRLHGNPADAFVTMPLAVFADLLVGAEMGVR